MRRQLWPACPELTAARLWLQPANSRVHRCPETTTLTSRPPPQSQNPERLGPWTEVLKPHFLTDFHVLGSSSTTPGKDETPSLAVTVLPREGPLFKAPPGIPGLSGCRPGRGFQVRACGRHRQRGDAACGWLPPPSRAATGRTRTTTRKRLYKPETLLFEKEKAKLQNVYAWNLLTIMPKPYKDSELP